MGQEDGGLNIARGGPGWIMCFTLPRPLQDHGGDRKNSAKQGASTQAKEFKE